MLVLNALQIQRLVSAPRSGRFRWPGKLFIRVNARPYQRHYIPVLINKTYWGEAREKVSYIITAGYYC